MPLDKGQEEVDMLIAQAEQEILNYYQRAEKELSEKINDYWKRYKKKDKVQKARLEAGEITEEEYKHWRIGQLIIGKRWEEMRANIAADLTNYQNIAKNIVKEYTPDVYAAGFNYGTYSVENAAKLDTSFTLYDRPTVERLVREKPQLLPDLNPYSKTAQEIANKKILKWHEEQIQAVAMQGILQGESIPKIAERISGITNQDAKATIRYARTMTTGAENAGRIDSYKRAESMGIEMEQQWLATLDGRTRHSHRQMDGEHVPVGKKFSNGCEYPGDPKGPAGEIWCCRCTLVAMLTGIPELDEVNDLSNTALRYDDNLNGMSYEEWKKGHGQSRSITHQKDVGESIKQKAINEYINAAKRLKNVEVD